MLFKHFLKHTICQTIQMLLTKFDLYFAKDEDLEQMEKLAKLIRDLKAQEEVYVDILQRSIVSTQSVNTYILYGIQHFH